MTLSYFSKFPDFGRSFTATDGQGISTQAGSNGSTAANVDTIRSKSAVVQPVAFEIAHQLNGRLRLRIPRLAHDQAFARRLAAAVTALPGVTRARVSPQSRSLVVHYEKRPFRPSRNGHQESSHVFILAELVNALQTAAGDKTERDLTTPKTDKIDFGRINYLQRLGLPVLGLGLGAGVVAGLGLPPLLVGGAILVSAIPIFKRTAQGIRAEKRMPVDLLPSAAIVLLTVQSSFLAPSFVVVVF